MNTTSQGMRLFQRLLVLTASAMAACTHAALPLATNNLRSLQLLAKAGEAHALYELGRRHDHAIGVSQSDRQAITYYRQAAAQDLPQALYQLGRKYAAGEGVPRDRTLAFEWFRKAAERDYPLAQNRLGRSFELGEGVKRDVVEAYKWYTLASRHGAQPHSIANRDRLARRMHPDQIAEAELRASGRVAALW